MSRWRTPSFITLAALLLSCAAPAAGPRPAGELPSVSAPAAAERLVIGLAAEPASLAATILPALNSLIWNAHEIVSQGLTSMDDEGNPVPKLSAEVPSLDRGTWRIRPDGGMDVAFRLRDNALWHDGTPVTLDDVRFSVRVYQDRRVPILFRVVDPVDDITQEGARGFVMHWSQVYAFADRLTFRDFTVLPRHLLEPTYTSDPTSLANLPYWTESYVGTGPYRVLSWERGAQLELQAFDRFFLGKPKIDRITVRFITDENTMLASLLAGEIGYASGNSAVSPNRAVEITEQVRQMGLGGFKYGPSGTHLWVYQYANNPAAAPLRDLRVRQALIFALDRKELAEFGTAGLGGPVETWIAPDEPRYSAAEPFITKYSYDPRRAVALLQEAGWTRGADGSMRDGSGQVLACEVRTTSQQGMDVAAVGAQMWRAIGVDASGGRIPPSLVSDAEYRATFPCIDDTTRTSGLSNYDFLHSRNIMSAANGWKGQNRSGWSHPELDDATERFLGSPREADRLVAERDMIRVITAEAPYISLNITLQALYARTGLTGPNTKRGMWPDASFTWNIDQWELRTSG